MHMDILVEQSSNAVLVAVHLIMLVSMLMLANKMIGPRQKPPGEVLNCLLIF